MELLNWNYQVDEKNIVWLTLDKHNSSTNTLSADVLEEFKTILQALTSTLKPKGLVINSAKKNGFIAGADIQQFDQLQTEEDAFNLIRQGQILFQKLEDLPFPTVALIHGFCLGGGLELALACRYRIVEEDPSTKLGLPEVNLGIHPGWGGTIRLPQRIGALKAMDLILSGRSVSAKQALKLGFVDAVVPKRHLVRAAQYYILNEPPVRYAKGLEAITHWNSVRPLLGKWLYRKLSEKVNRMHYPAPYAVIDHFIQHGVHGESAYISEAKSVAQLMVSDVARNLVRVFHLKETLKGLSRDITFIPQHVHVIGAGVMGGDIAAWCVLKGLSVSIQDQSLTAIAATLKRAQTLFQKTLKEPHLVRAAQDRLLPDSAGLGIAKADLIIEAIIEKSEAKQRLFQELETLAKPTAVLATNTSSLTLEELSQSLRNPERLVGIHFFNPVAKMPLVEVVTGPETDPQVVNQAIAFVKFIEKLPLPVKSAPGFLVNRMLAPYLMESIQLLEEGVPPQAIDRAAIEFGMPVGPIELADTVGLDVCLHAALGLKQRLEGHIPSRVKILVEQGHLGKKTGQGFYRYKNGMPIKEPLDAHYRLPEDIIDRLILRMINEGIACLRENIVSKPDLVDAGMIFGAGFPPFRGGPLHYAMEQGQELLLQRLNLLVQRYGSRFAVDPGWDKKAHG